MTAYTMSSETAAELGNFTLSVIDEALRRGLAPEAAVGIILTATADYARARYGDDYLDQLAELILYLKGQPLPGKMERRSLPDLEI